MSTAHYLELKDKVEIQKYVKPSDADRKESIAFSGSPRKHPHDSARVILVADPFSENTFFYEFNVDDIVFVEELPSISNLSGDSVSMVRLWVKKNSVAIRCTPFIVNTVIKS